MIAIDTNILFPLLETTHRNHKAAREYFNSQKQARIVICELVLVEIYQLVRNATICRHPLNSLDAANLIIRLRENPDWELIDYPGGLMNEVWELATRVDIPRRRIFDIRLALAVRHYGVTSFATANVKDFQNLGFERVWNPLE